MGKQLEPSDDRYVPDSYQGKLEPNYYCRSWNEKRDKYCKARAGKGTDHPGVGRCTHHGGSSPIKSGRYSTIQRERIRDLIEEFEDDPDPLDLRPELAALRAIFRDFIERYDQHANELHVWYTNIPEPLRDSILAVAGDRPKRILDLADAWRILKEIGEMVSKIEKVRSDQAISRKDFLRVITEMGRAVELRVEDPKVLGQIKHDWATIRLA